MTSAGVVSSDEECTGCEFRLVGIAHLASLSEESERYRVSLFRLYDQLYDQIYDQNIYHEPGNAH